MKDKEKSFQLQPIDLILALLVIVFALGGFYFLNKTNQLERPAVKQTKKVVAKNPRFEACLNNHRYASKVNQSSDQAQAAGIMSTPTSVIYDLKTGRKFAVIGAQTYETVKNELKQFMAGKNIPLPKGVKLNLSKIKKPTPKEDHWQGNPKARYVLIEYSDFECPFCRRFHQVPEKLLKDFGQNLAWVYRHIPLTSIHPNSQQEAEASECAAELGGNQGFWNYANKLFKNTKSNGRSFDKNDLIDLANKLGLK